mmetsp:Transcript_9352/g.20707  ORF Transcript_9352/g.20707 Transcript_9352/m.20707 type:complete len:226 (-) Transcript_9352:705-1382(-)
MSKFNFRYPSDEESDVDSIASPLLNSEAVRSNDSITPLFWYSATLFSKKFVFPSRLIISIQSNGFVDPKIGEYPISLNIRSATNSTYCAIISAFIPINATSRASHTNPCSTATASLTILCTVCSSNRFSNFPYNAHANAQCSPSSREISSLLKVSPGISPRFLSQKMAQNDPLKKIPSTHAKATRRSEKDAPDPIHLLAHSALAATAGIRSWASKRRSRSIGSRT